MSDVEVGPARDPREEREERSLALERTYVHEVYDQIAPQLQLQDNIRSRSRIWPRVCQFLSDLEPASLVCDVGCGTGSYLDLNSEVFKVGSDRCRSLADIAHGRGPNGQEVLVCDNMQLPFRDESFDAVLSVAVVHHFATTERRVQALRELARVLRIGGRLMITVWALEQRHRRFESQDVLVPWHKPEPRSSSEDQTSIDKDMASTTTTSDDDLLNYHAYTSGLESEPYFVPFSRKHRIRERWLRRKGRTLDSSSQSSSDLSSPNETCYSFVRRALQKLSSSSGGAGGRTWEAGSDPRRRCRPPWFFKDVEHPFHRSCTFRLDKTDSQESTEDADDIPIELHDVDNAAELDRYGPAYWEEDENGARTPAGGGWCWTGATPYRPGRAFSSCSKPLNHKSKSLSDILSLFTANFRSSRKLSASTTEGRTTSTCRRSTSSGSSSETKASVNLRSSVTLEQHPEPVDTGQRANDADEIQTAVQAPVVHPRRRGSPTSYKSTSQACGDCRRPKSLLLTRDFRIPRTLSAEDHRNGNTILPDLDSCLTFYGFLNKNNANDFPSPPYTKESKTAPTRCDHAQVEEVVSCIEPIEVPVEKKRLQDFQAKPGKSSWPTTDHCSRTDFKNTVYYEESPQCKDRSILPEDSNEPVRVLNDNGWKDVVCLNLINRLIEHEHLFPCRSMPNIYINDFKETIKTDICVGKLVTSHDSELPTVIRDGTHVLKKQSCSVDGSGWMECGSWRRGRENWSNRKPARLCFKRSMSTDDSEFNYPWKTTDNGRLPKEDSLQSDTSVDSDDSIASVIAVCKERNPSSGSGSNECRSDVRNEECIVGPLRNDSLETDVILPCETLHSPLKGSSSDDLICENLPSMNPPLKSIKSSVCTSVSWEKYLDACKSTVLDTVEFVNSIYRDFKVDDKYLDVDCPQLVHSDSQVFDSSHSQLIIDYVCSPGDEPQTAEMCWLDPGCGEAIADDLLLLSDNDEQCRTSPNSQSPDLATIVALSSSAADEHPEGAACSSRVTNEYEDQLVMSSHGPEIVNFEGCRVATGCFDKRTLSADSIREISVRIKKKSLSAEEIKARREDEINGNVTKIFRSNGRHVDILDEVMDNVTETEEFQCEKQQSICEMNLEKCFSTKEYNFHKSQNNVCTTMGMDQIISEEKVPIECRWECGMLQESCLEKTLLGGTQRMNSSNDTITLRKPSHTVLPATAALTPVGGKISASSDLELMSSSIETPFGKLEFLADAESDTCGACQLSSVDVDKSVEAEACGVMEDACIKELDEPCADVRDSLSVSTSDDSVLSGSENGGSPTYHRYYHVFREGELEQLIDKYVENLHIISSYYDHANWCIVAEKVRVWKI